ncbi:ABC transporter ATP-binding protein [Rathayibacter sp. AY1G1]|jgi:peptide/nickel transport system ATP-binding protein|uniref:dipeptide ABC transporter ATP-binding protein n=2 Tax=Rathayibacter TaxID=33886 RepID=UPI000CE85905|nr:MULTISPECIES: ABC transporter ATP-binding protein [unclassified Rathayibacter]PPF12774.1 ABC transporter ATP-binding protein [Rathayibacter sp. AY1A5]PPF22439.1 ABC transporter ATP-binding protein [Rathayibacter sp. AY1A7]PPF41299.1 ABC transporter ATP-binding protein [Rathayibacter sp. AY1A2]PPG18554.1 ABC transporter ATP-binding protein [Rathayibacter sp. AY1C6]PPG44779.1 ABC transporter ATP-binding protein [Rathayibacter sp. AY2B5]
MTATTPNAPHGPLLEVTDLEVGFQTGSGLVPALRGVSLTIEHGQTVAIVGESGSGKSTTAAAIIGLLPGTGQVTAGSVLFDGKDLAKATRTELEDIRGRRIGYVPQDPMSNLNPVWSVGFQVEETIKANGLATGRKEVRAKAIEVLQNAGLADAEKRLKQFPHQFSGGMRQRVLIGIGLAAAPQLLIADEPTSALDVTVQRRILDHLETLTKTDGTALLFITHDLGLAAERAEKLIVMYKGRIVESGASVEVLQNPQHPYTQRLIAAAPSLASRRIQSTAGRAVESVSGESEAVREVDLVGAGAAHHAGAVASGAPMIEVDGLTKVFKIRRGGLKAEDFTAVDNVSFSIPKGTTTALVGESGSGKSTIARLVLGLETATSGAISIAGRRTEKLKGRDMLALRRSMQPVFQDPYGSLDPLHNIGNTISEPLRVHKVGDRTSQRERVLELLDQVSLPRVIASRYPNELSGGQRQRVAIARALALKPEIVVLDEAVSALDVLVQAQILRLLADLQAELGLTYLFITHDLAVVRVIADDVCVMQKGRIVEHAPTDTVFDSPQQEYTRELLDAIPGAGIEFAV